MQTIEKHSPGADFLKSLGFPTLDVHETFTHFDFTTPGRRVLLIGPMGAGKTEKAAGIWRDAAVALKKSDAVSALTSTGIADRRRVFFIRYAADAGADFVKTSTGFSTGGATVHDVALMKEAVSARGLKVKASGGIRNYKDAKAMIDAGADRIGASAGIAIVKEENAEA